MKHTEKELRTLNYVFRVLIRQYRQFYEIGSDIDYKEKKNKGEYGYYINERPRDLIRVLDKYAIKSILDLGAGAGHIVTLLNMLGYNARGVEIEKTLIERGLTTRVKHCNIFDLTRGDIEYCEALYFWEPFYSKELSRKFVNLLMKIMVKNQLIIYRQSGYIRDFLYQKVLNKELFQYKNRDSELLIYKKL